MWFDHWSNSTSWWLRQRKRVSAWTTLCTDHTGNRNVISVWRKSHSKWRRTSYADWWTEFWRVSKNDVRVLYLKLKEGSLGKKSRFRPVAFRENFSGGGGQWFFEQYYNSFRFSRKCFSNISFFLLFNSMSLNLSPVYFQPLFNFVKPGVHCPPFGWKKWMRQGGKKNNRSTQNF